MKKIKTVFFMAIIAIVFTNCQKENTEAEIDLKSYLPGKWELVGLVNISDQDKYLNTVLEFSNTNNYSNSEQSGEQILSGDWSELSDLNKINLSLGIFWGDGSTDYKVIKNDGNTMILEENYTKDNKNAILEYHYKRIR